MAGEKKVEVLFSVSAGSCTLSIMLNDKRKQRPGCVIRGMPPLLDRCAQQNKKKKKAEGVHASDPIKV